MTVATSGLLEVQLVTDHGDPEPSERAAFLVDIVEGSTWLLRQRTNGCFEWQPVEVFNSSQYP